MSSRLVREAAAYHHNLVSNAMWDVGYTFRDPYRRPRNVRVMLDGLPKHALEQVVAILRRGGYR